MVDFWPCFVLNKTARFLFLKENRAVDLYKYTKIIVNGFHSLYTLSI
jgi:hypothetical protein